MDAEERPGEGWVETGTILDDAGDLGGDNQVGKAYSRRFIHPDKPGRLIDVVVYGVYYQNPDAPGGLEYGVEEQIERMICRDMEDPGGTEEWSDHQYSAIDGYPVLHTVQAAQVAARLHLTRLEASDLVWDGEPK